MATETDNGDSEQFCLRQAEKQPNPAYPSSALEKYGIHRTMTGTYYCQGEVFSSVKEAIEFAERPPAERQHSSADLDDSVEHNPHQKLAWFTVAWLIVVSVFTLAKLFSWLQAWPAILLVWASRPEIPLPLVLPYIAIPIILLAGVLRGWQLYSSNRFWRACIVSATAILVAVLIETQTGIAIPIL